MKQLVFASIVLIAALQTGCVTGRRTLSLPIATGKLPAIVKGHVHIAAVTDDRQFQNSPSDPSTPSVNGDVTKLSAQEKDRMVGRQRNGFGKAWGDVALAEGNSVTKQVRLLVEQALRRQGYEVTTDPATANSMSVSVEKFWGWMTPGFVALSFEAQLQCRVSLTTSGGTNTVTVKGYALNHGQFAKDENWIEAFDPAFDDFVTNLDNAAPSLGLHPDGSSGSAHGSQP